MSEYTGNKNTNNHTLMDVLLTLKQNIMKDLNVAEVCKVVEIKSNSTVVVVPINNDKQRLHCYNLYQSTISLNDLVLVVFTNTDSRTNLNKSSLDISMQNTSTNILHSLNYGIIVGKSSGSGGDVKLYNTIGQNTDGAMTQKASTDNFALKSSVHDAILTISKNGTPLGTFSANANTNQSIDITVPTQASEVNALPDSTKYAASISLTISSNTITVQLIDQDGNNIGSSQSISVSVPNAFINASYNNTTKTITFTYADNTSLPVDISSIISGLQAEITSNNMLSSDLVDDTNKTHKFATSAQLTQIDTNKTDIDNIKALIPAQATPTNQMADKDFVNSSINALAAFYITRTAAGGNFRTNAELMAATTFYSGGSSRVPTQNDYTYVQYDETKGTQASGYSSFTTTAEYVGYYVIYNNEGVEVTTSNKDSVGITPGTTIAYENLPTTRYSYQGGTYPSGQWDFQLIVNNSSLTAAQIAAINSGITAALVTQISTNQTNIAGLVAAAVTNVSFDSANNKIQITINGVTTDVVTFGSNAFNSTVIPVVTFTSGSEAITVSNNVLNIMTRDTQQTVTALKIFNVIPQTSSLGMNLFTENYTLTQSSRLNATGGLDTVSGYGTTDYLDILTAGKSYDVEFTLTSDPTSSIYSRICFYDENETWISNEDDFDTLYSTAGTYHRTITMPSNAKYIRYSISALVSETKIKEIGVLANVMNENDVDNKLASKVTARSVWQMVYGTDSNNQQTVIRYTETVGSAGTLVARHNDGQIMVPQMPTQASHASSKSYVDSMVAALTGSSAPLSSTIAYYVGQLYLDTTNDKVYICTAITAQGTTPETYLYTWSEVSGGGSGGSTDYNDLSNKPILNTNNSSSQSANSSETISGTINLHKISKTGKLADTIKDSDNRVVSDAEKETWNTSYDRALVTAKNTQMWFAKTWNNAPSDLTGNNIWTDGENIYWSQGGSHYKLNKLTDSWESVTFNGYTFFSGECVWNLGEHTYYSLNNNQYELNKDTLTWVAKTWTGLTSFDARNIWVDNRNDSELKIYYSNGSSHYYLDPATSTWSSCSFSGLSSFYGSNIWSDGQNIYYNSYYKLKKNYIRSWESISMSYSFERNDMWCDGNSWYACTYSSQTCYLYKFNQVSKKWETHGRANVNISQYVKIMTWTDGENIYYTNGTSASYVLDTAKSVKPVTAGCNQRNPNNIGWMKTILKNLQSAIGQIHNITIVATPGSESISDGINTLNFGSNAFNSTPIPTVNNASLYLQLNGNAVATFTANASSDVTANIQALPNYSLSIGSTNGGNPRQVKFLSVNYTNYDGNNACFVKLGAMCSHGNGASYTFMDDIFIGVSSSGSVLCNVYKYFQQSVTLDGVTRYYGDVFYTIDTTNKVVDFYILLGQYSTANFTPYTKIGSTTTNGITQLSGTPTYYSSGTKVWANGDGTTYARLSDIPDTSNFVTTNTAQTISAQKTFSNSIYFGSGSDDGAIYYDATQDAFVIRGKAYDPSAIWKTYKRPQIYTGNLLHNYEEIATKGDIPDLLSKVYPVGSIYLSTSQTSPASFLGGTWEALAEGKALWTTTTANTGGKTIAAGLPNIGGKFFVGGNTMSTSESSRVGGAIRSGNQSNISGEKGGGGGSDNRVFFNAYQGDVGTTKTITNSTTYSDSSVYGNSTTVQPPAIRVYAWKRTN